jgi:hypothetical protein
MERLVLARVSVRGRLVFRLREPTVFNYLGILPHHFGCPSISTIATWCHTSPLIVSSKRVVPPASLIITNRPSSGTSLVRIVPKATQLRHTRSLLPENRMRVLSCASSLPSQGKRGPLSIVTRARTRS